MFKTSLSGNSKLGHKTIQTLNLLLGSCLFSLCTLTQAATIIIEVSDSPGEGFNDLTPLSPTGGNSGTTLGEQRLIVFQDAADNWGQFIESDVDIKVSASFNPLTCSAYSAILGSAGPQSATRDMTPDARPNTWYGIALANALAGQDLNGNQAEIVAQFNSAIDNNNNCLNGTNWYYGIDGNAPHGTIDLHAVVMHEIGHGLGFSSFVNSGNGQKFYGFDDIYSTHLMDHTTGKSWPEMNDQERYNSARNQYNLLWSGENTNNAADHLLYGRKEGKVQMFSPTTLKGGSSVSHFDTSLMPNELMEPYATGPKEDPGLAITLMQDLGWELSIETVNLAPEVSDIANVDVEMNEITSVNFTINDSDTDIEALSILINSRDQSILSNENIQVDRTASEVRLTLTPTRNARGATNISVEVSDGEKVTEVIFQYKLSALGVVSRAEDTEEDQDTGSDSSDSDNSDSGGGTPSESAQERILAHAQETAERDAEKAKIAAERAKSAAEKAAREQAIAEEAASIAASLVSSDGADRRSRIANRHATRTELRAAYAQSLAERTASLAESAANRATRSADKYEDLRALYED